MKLFEGGGWEINLVGKVWNLRIARHQLALWKRYAPIFNFLDTEIQIGPAVAVILLLVFLAAPAVAAEPVPCGSVQPEACASLYTGTTSVLTRGQKREFITARATASAPLFGKLGGFLRADLGGTQDGGALADPRLFRTIEGIGGLRYPLGKRLRVSAIGGATFSVEGDSGRPIDSRLFTVAALVGAKLGDGYIEVGAGHHGPVGGPALLFATSIPFKGGTATTVDLAFPLRRNVFQEKTWVLRVGANVRVKTIHLW